MSNVHVAAYYANRFDPDTLFPELAIVPSADIFYGTPLSSLNILEIEFEASFDGVLVSALGIKDVSSDFENNFLPEGNPSLANINDSTIAINRLMATIGLTFLTSPVTSFVISNQMLSMSQPTLTYSNDFILSNVASQLDYKTTLAYESKFVQQNQYVHAGYKFFLVNITDSVATDLNPTSVPSMIFIRESTFNVSLSL